MKSYDELKAEMEAIQQQMVEAKKNERANALKEVKRLCKQIGFTAGMLKGSLAEGRKAKECNPNPFYYSSVNGLLTLNIALKSMACGHLQLYQ